MILKGFSTEYFKKLKNLRKRQIIFFNGCFDILHPGHLTLINYVKNVNENYASDSIIICAINSDESVKLQNKKHPLINNETIRAKTLEMLGLDYIIIFDEKTPLALLMSLIPDELVTTSQYIIKHDCDDLNFCRNHGIKISYIAMLTDYSTTSIYNKIEEQIRAKIRESI